MHDSRFRMGSILPVFIAFLASGASSLIAEVTWNRMLIVVVGNSMSATAMILVVFMGGLGFGSYVGGRFFARRPATLLPYVLLETVIGFFILLSPSLFGGLSSTFSSLAEVTSSGALLTAVRILVSLAALFVPASLMGATFPAIVSGTADDSTHRRTARTGYLYAVNTLGAAVGCFAAGFHLLFEFGVQVTLNCAFALNVVAALSALVAAAVGRGRPASPVAERARAEQAGDVAPVGARTRRFVAVATFGTGFVALAYEVLLTRVGILYLGNVTSVFALVLTGFLLGTAVSALLGTWLWGLLQRRTRHSQKLFGGLALAGGALIMGTPYFLLTDGAGLASGALSRAASSSVPDPLAVLGIIVAPTLFIGALLPVAIRMLQPGNPAAATREAATLYALNTAGGLVGAALINQLFVPLIGLQGALAGLTLIVVALGLVNLLDPGANGPRWVLAISGVALVGALLVLPPRLMGLYVGKLEQSTGATAVRTLLVREGRAANVTVLDQTHPGIGTFRDMYLNGVEEASTRYWHTQLFKLLGIMPGLVRESDAPRHVLVIAFGAGITAGSTLASDDVASLDVVDLNPDIEGINDLFTAVNGDVFHSPRFHFHNDDGRNYLVTRSTRYDTIICDSTHPRAYDSWILYTREFYESVKKRLQPDGIFAQWVPVDASMRGELFAIHLNTFRSVFPNATLWYVYGSDQAFLLATPHRLEIDPRRMQARLDRLPAWFRARDYQIDTVARVAGFFWLDQAAMSRMIGGETRVNTDDFHYLDKQSAVWPLVPDRQLPRYQAGVLPYLRDPDPALRAAVEAQQAVAQRMARYGFFWQPRDLLAAYCLMPDNGDVRFFMSGVYGERWPDRLEACQRLAPIRAGR